LHQGQALTQSLNHCLPACLRNSRYHVPASVLFRAMWKYLETTTTVPSVAAVALTGDTLWCGLWGVLTSGFFVVTLNKNGCLQVSAEWDWMLHISCKFVWAQEPDNIAPLYLQTIFGTLLVTFFLLAGANYSENCHYAAGYIGCFCGASAIYTALAELYKVPCMCFSMKLCWRIILLVCMSQVEAAGAVMTTDQVAPEQHQAAMPDSKHSMYVCHAPVHCRMSLASSCQAWHPQHTSLKF
jgi:hypothetical protein